MSAQIMVVTRELEGEISRTSVPNIWAAFAPELVRTLQEFDSSITGNDLRFQQGFISKQVDPPFDGYESAKLLMTIHARGNDRLGAAREEIEASLQRKLRDALSPIPDIFVRLLT